MITKEAVINNQVGLHARPATFFIQKANEFKSSIWIEKDERRVNAKSLLGVLSLGIVKGTTDTTFVPNATVTRAQFVTFLWRYEDCPSSSIANPFSDVSESSVYAPAILWAAENGVTVGTGNGTFVPNGACTRAHVVTFLYRNLAK